MPFPPPSISAAVDSQQILHARWSCCARRVVFLRLLFLIRVYCVDCCSASSHFLECSACIIVHFFPRKEPCPWRKTGVCCDPSMFLWPFMPASRICCLARPHASLEALHGLNIAAMSVLCLPVNVQSTGLSCACAMFRPCLCLCNLLAMLVCACGAIFGACQFSV